MIRSIRGRTEWTPAVVPRIPKDIPSEEHPRIMARLAEVNTSLVRCPTLRKDAALDRAAWALHGSGVGACGVPTAYQQRGGEDMRGHP